VQPNSFYPKLVHHFYCGKKQLKKLDYFCNFRKTAHRKQSPNGRKFAHSGHPACRWLLDLVPTQTFSNSATSCQAYQCQLRVHLKSRQYFFFVWTIFKIGMGLEGLRHSLDNFESTNVPLDSVPLWDVMIKSDQCQNLSFFRKIDLKYKRNSTKATARRQNSGHWHEKSIHVKY
jgi:hypothetical protein